MHDQHWKMFASTGKVEDYIAYCQSKPGQIKPSPEDVTPDADIYRGDSHQGFEAG
jgi:hypothetical protein